MRSCRSSSSSLADLRLLPPPNLPSRPPSFPRLHVARRFFLPQVKASSPKETPSSSVENGGPLAELKEKWDASENKSAVYIYGGGVVVAVWLSSFVISAIDSVPLFPKIMELVGLGFTIWFVNRYLLFKSGREELKEDFEALKRRIAGSGE